MITSSIKDRNVKYTLRESELKKAMKKIQIGIAIGLMGSLLMFKGI